MGKQGVLYPISFHHSTITDPSLREHFGVSIRFIVCFISIPLEQGGWLHCLLRSQTTNWPPTSKMEHWNLPWIVVQIQTWEILTLTCMLRKNVRENVYLYKHWGYLLWTILNPYHFTRWQEFLHLTPHRYIYDIPSWPSFKMVSTFCSSEGCISMLMS